MNKENEIPFELIMELLRRDHPLVLENSLLKARIMQYEEATPETDEVA